MNLYSFCLNFSWSYGPWNPGLVGSTPRHWHLGLRGRAILLQSFAPPGEAAKSLPSWCSWCQRCPCALKLPQLQVTRTSNLPLVSECPTRCGCAHYDTFLGSLRWWTSQFQCRCNQMWISGTLKSRYTPHNISQLLKAHRKVKSRFRGLWGESAFHGTWMARSEWAAWSVVRVAHGASTRKIDENNTHRLLFVSRWISRDHGVPVSHSPEAPDVGEAVWILGLPVKSPSLTYETLKKLTNSDPRPSCWLSTWWKRRKWYCGWFFDGLWNIPFAFWKL